WDKQEDHADRPDCLLSSDWVVSVALLRSPCSTPTAVYRAVRFGLALLAGSLARLPAPGLQGAHPVVEFLDGLDERGDQAAVVDLLASLLVGRHQLQEDLLDSWAITWAITPGHAAAWLRGAHCRYHRG